MSDLLPGPVEVVGAGLIGTSIALACRRAGVDVLLSDTSAENLRTATGLGAGHPKGPGGSDSTPALVVVAVPPDHLGAAIAAALDAAAEDTVVTDVGSVKAGPLAEVADHRAAARYVGSHPMAGSERSGPLAASADLFTGRPWAICRHDGATATAVRRVAALVEICGAVPVMLTPTEHDKAVARTSHVPHLLASLVAGTLAGAAPEHLALTGQGVRDVTRVAAGDPTLYSQIIGGNSEAVAGLLREVRARLDLALDAVAAVGAVADVVGDRCGVIAFADVVQRRLVPRRANADAVVRALYDLEPTGVDSDYHAAFADIGTTKRALVLVLTDLLEEAAARPLLAATPTVARGHAVVVASVADPDLLALLGEPSSPRQVYAAAVATEVLEARARVAHQLARTGATVLEARPDELAAACVGAYLGLRARARL